MSITNLLTYHINSSNRIAFSSDSDNFYAQIEIPQDVKDKLNYCSITNIEIPKSYYLIQNKLNYFSLFENGVETIIYIPIGNYTYTDLFLVVKNLLIDNSPNSLLYDVFEITNLNTPPIKQLVINPDLNKIAITISNNISNIPVYLFFDDITLIDIILGFNPAQNNFDLLTNTYIIAPNMYNLNPINSCYLISDCIDNTYNDGIGNSNLCQINLSNVPYGSIIEKTYDIIENKKKLNLKNNIIHFTFVNMINSSTFNLNNIDCSFTFHLMTYTPNIKYYINTTELLDIIAKK